jgi:hypothetical protein
MYALIEKRAAQRAAASTTWVRLAEQIGSHSAEVVGITSSSAGAVLAADTCDIGVADQLWLRSEFDPDVGLSVSLARAQSDEGSSSCVVFMPCLSGYGFACAAVFLRSFQLGYKQTAQFTLGLYWQHPGVSAALRP